MLTVAAKATKRRTNLFKSGQQFSCILKVTVNEKWHFSSLSSVFRKILLRSDVEIPRQAENHRVEQFRLRVKMNGLYSPAVSASKVLFPTISQNHLMFLPGVLETFALFDNNHFASVCFLIFLAMKAGERSLDVVVNKCVILCCNCYQNKGELSLNQSNLDYFVKRLAKNNSKNNDSRHKIHHIFLTDYFVLAITLVWKTVHTLAMAQITAYLLEKTMQLTVLLKRSLLQLV